MPSPIIFVPGTSGSFLRTPEQFHYDFLSDKHTLPDATINHSIETFMYSQDSAIWLGSEMVSAVIDDTFNGNEGNHWLDVLSFSQNGQPNQGDQAFPPIGVQDVTEDVIKEVDIGIAGFKAPVYKTLLEFLHTRYDSTGVFHYAYDWRLDLRQQIDGLAQRITDVRAATGADKVILIAHSLGGLICRAYYLQSAEHANTVDKVITMGTGLAGIPKTFKILLAGDTWGLGFNLGSLLDVVLKTIPGLAGFLTWLAVGLAEWEIQDLAQNWPTPYFQAPNSEDWFFDDKSKGGGNTHDRTYIRDTRPNQPLPTPIDYQTSMAWLQQNGHNGTLINESINFFRSIVPSLGDFVNEQNPPVPHYRIISTNIDTIVATHVFLQPSQAANFAIETGQGANTNEYVPIPWNEPILGDGDDTVPYHGALGKSNSNDSHVFVLANAWPNHTGHMALPEDPDVQRLIGCIIDGTSPDCLAGTPFFRPSDVPEH